MTVNAKSGGTFSYGGDKYIFKLSGHCQTTGLLLNSVDFISEAINHILCIQIKNKINMFKQKVEESIVNGAVTISFQFPKLIYEFELAKDEKLSHLYVKLTVTLELNIDLNAIVKDYPKK